MLKWRPVVLSIVLLFGVLPAESHSKGRNSDLKLQPCDVGFDLKMSVAAAGGEGDHHPFGLQLSYSKSGRGLAQNLDQSQKQSFDKHSCEKWQANQWPHLKRILLENKSHERSGVVCRNIASIEYKLGSNFKKSKLCLGSSREDGVTYGFHRFYEGTENILSPQAKVGR